MQADQPDLSVVVPVYGCAACLGLLCERVTRAVAPLDLKLELVLVDDRAPDDAWSEITRLQMTYPVIRGLKLSRNFGQQIAISAGLAAARGRLVVVMDCDLQDPPERIPDLYAKLMEGYDLVMARRAERTHSRNRLWAAKAYFWLLSRLTGRTVDGSYGSFSILTRPVVDAYLRFSERDRHYLFILRWLGFNVGVIEYRHEDRAAGKSAYSLSRLLRHAFSGFLFETVLLRWIVFGGLAFSFSSVLAALVLFYRHFVIRSVPGWTSLMVLLLFCTGVILISLGVLGLYLGKIFEQTKGRPLYLVETMTDHAVDRTFGPAHSRPPERVPILPLDT